jgi:hypothetical protein
MKRDFENVYSPGKASPVLTNMVVKENNFLKNYFPKELFS